MSLHNLREQMSCLPLLRTAIQYLVFVPSEAVSGAKCKPSAGPLIDIGGMIQAGAANAIAVLRSFVFSTMSIVAMAGNLLLLFTNRFKLSNIQHLWPAPRYDSALALSLVGCDCCNKSRQQLIFLKTNGLGKNKSRTQTIPLLT